MLSKEERLAIHKLLLAYEDILEDSGRERWETQHGHDEYKAAKLLVGNADDLNDDIKTEEFWKELDKLERKFGFEITIYETEEAIGCEPIATGKAGWWPRPAKPELAE